MPDLHPAWLVAPDSLAVVASFGLIDFAPIQLPTGTADRLVDSGAESYLLFDGEHRLSDDLSRAGYEPANASSDASAHASAHASADANCDQADHTAPDWRSFQLRHRLGGCMGRRQEGVVLPSPSHRLSHCGSASGDSGDTLHDASSCARGSLQLRRWLCQLAGRVVCGQEGMVLQSPQQGLPSGRRLRDDVAPVRLQRGLG